MECREFERSRVATLGHGTRRSGDIHVQHGKERIRNHYLSEFAAGIGAFSVDNHTILRSDLQRVAIAPSIGRPINGAIEWIRKTGRSILERSVRMGGRGPDVESRLCQLAWTALVEEPLPSNPCCCNPKPSKVHFAPADTSATCCGLTSSSATAHRCRLLALLKFRPMRGQRAWLCSRSLRSRVKRLKPVGRLAPLSSSYVLMTRSNGGSRGQSRQSGSKASLEIGSSSFLMHIKTTSRQKRFIGRKPGAAFEASTNSASSIWA